MKIFKLIRFFLCGFFLISAANLWAQDRGPARGDRGGIEGFVQKLELTETQKEQVKKIFVESRASRKEIFAEHGIEFGKGVRPDREQMKAARPDMTALRKETEAKVKEVLTDEQLDKLKELRSRGGKKNKKGKKSDQAGDS